VLENIPDVPKLVMPAFEQGKIILFKCTRNTSMVLANKRQP
jgi:hypothetical protein